MRPKTPITVDMSAYRKRRYRKNIKLGLCVRCEERNRSRYSHCPKCRRALVIRVKAYERERLKEPEHRLDRNRRKNESNKKLKIACFDAYGGPKCECCGENKVNFLNIDHIHGNVHIHRKGKYEGIKIYTTLRKEGYPSGYRVLCYNCNCGRYINGGICPHKDQARAGRFRRV